ncbi:MAG: sugar phosphate isomerase/epimerase [Spirochaetaceae bacterium]|jgi:D-psicose/D-tagatose/L-ribulose 3-epimerase|nr:sugar phosphate isomerase/epimerase [Spirochaetaceae bacterium]
MYRPVGIFYAYWVHEWDVDFLPFVDRVKRLGFDLLELHAAVLADKSREYRLKIKETAERAGIALSYGMGLEEQYDVSSLNEERRLAGVARMKQIIRGVGEMGGGLISGTVHSYWPAVFPREADSKEPMRRQSVKSMKELAPFAAEHGVMLNVEVINRFEQFLINTAGEALAYVEEVDSPACNILLDTFHMNIEEDSLGDAIRGAGKRLAALHLGEPNRKPPGMGRMPWGEIKKALDDINFQGPLVMEPFLTPGGGIGRAVGVWRDIVKNPDLDALAEKAAAFVKQNLR